MGRRKAERSEGSLMVRETSGSKFGDNQPFTCSRPRPSFLPDDVRCGAGTASLMSSRSRERLSSQARSIVPTRCHTEGIDRPILLGPHCSNRSAHFALPSFTCIIHNDALVDRSYAVRSQKVQLNPHRKVEVTRANLLYLALLCRHLQAQFRNATHPALT